MRYKCLNIIEVIEYYIVVYIIPFLYIVISTVNSPAGLHYMGHFVKKHVIFSFDSRNPFFFKLVMIDERMIYQRCLLKINIHAFPELSIFWQLNGGNVDIWRLFSSPTCRLFSLTRRWLKIFGGVVLIVGFADVTWKYYAYDNSLCGRIYYNENPNKHSLPTDMGGNWLAGLGLRNQIKTTIGNTLF